MRMRALVKMYKCDICGKQVETEDELSERRIPIKSSDSDGRAFITRYGTVDMCCECSKTYEESVFNNFGIYRDVCGKFTFEKKGE